MSLTNLNPVQGPRLHPDQEMGAGGRTGYALAAYQAPPRAAILWKARHEHRRRQEAPP